MIKTLRILGCACIMLTLGLFVGCSDDSSTPTEPNTPSIAGSLGIYADAGGTDATITDTGGTVTVYVIHTVENGATASQFRVAAPAGWTLQSAAPQFAVSIGDADNGISLGYGSCLTGTIHVMTLTYTTPGTGTGSFRVLPHTDLPDAIQVVDCSQNLLSDAKGEATPVN